MLRRIGVITRDCAGVNAALRALVRTAASHNLEVLGIIRGYDGLIDGNLTVLDRRSVSGIINLGGTILKSARSERFLTAAGQQQALKTIREHGLDGLVVIGGNGSLSGAHLLATKYGIRVMGIPATIDNDVNGVDFCLGADTAVNVALDALDKIRDTATSLERIFVVEVMGRDCGYLAMKVALAGGCEDVLLPEQDFSLEEICREIEAGNARGKVSWIVIVAEGRATARDVAAAITGLTGLETRIAVLGHIQRGGRPTAFDRILAARLGNAAVEYLMAGETDKCVSLKNDSLELVPLEIAIQPKKLKFEPEYRLLKLLS
ncbi:MAG: ATP-dependent 6-phosphofructokinase [Candidatus Saccharicenans sp.]|jgi:6-phosphofructokinase 1|nr:6-phosphofructokinase [Candidatus Saccharicenans sp.]MDH7574461.1 ATP-dependent 6-phosphofructokinase [Candidatus Saccharicenans sp.]